MSAGNGNGTRPERFAAVDALDLEWAEGARWDGITRDYTAEDVIRLRGSLPIEHTLARHGAEKLWRLLAEEDYVPALGALTGGQAVQMAKAGLKAIYLSGWQVAADGNLAADVYPDQSLYPANSVPAMVRRLNNALLRADRIEWAEGEGGIDYLLPIVADAEAGFGGPLNAFELMKGMIESGAAAVHFEDQLSSEKKCGHLGGKVLVPTGQFIRTLLAARWPRTCWACRRWSSPARMPTPPPCSRATRTSATTSSSPVNAHRRASTTSAQASRQAIARGLAYAPYADLVWMETSTPDLGEAREFADAIHAEFPGKLLAYNCSPSFNWRRHLDDETIERFQRELGAMGYKFQFITLAGFHALNESMFELARATRPRGCPRMCGCRSGSSRSRTPATRRRSTSGRSVQAGSTRSPRRSPAAAARRLRSRARPRRRSSTATESPGIEAWHSPPFA
jgi:isocitrate lyase